MVEEFHVENARDLWIFGDLPLAFPPKPFDGWISRRNFPATIEADRCSTSDFTERGNYE